MKSDQFCHFLFMSLQEYASNYLGTFVNRELYDHVKIHLLSQLVNFEKLILHSIS